MFRLYRCLCFISQKINFQSPVHRFRSTRSQKSAQNSTCCCKRTLPSMVTVQAAVCLRLWLPFYSGAIKRGDSLPPPPYTTTDATCRMDSDGGQVASASKSQRNRFRLSHLHFPVFPVSFWTCHWLAVSVIVDAWEIWLILLCVIANGALRTTPHTAVGREIPPVRYDDIW